MGSAVARPVACTRMGSVCVYMKPVCPSILCYLGSGRWITGVFVNFPTQEVCHQKSCALKAMRLAGDQGGVLLEQGRWLVSLCLAPS